MKLIFKSEIDLKRIVFILIQSERFEMTKLEIKKDTRNKSFFSENNICPSVKITFLLSFTEGHLQAAWQPVPCEHQSQN